MRQLLQIVGKNDVKLGRKLCQIGVKNDVYVAACQFGAVQKFADKTTMGRI